MTEFALIVPIFLLIVAGLLAFGRVFFYWIEANHMASETARWAVVDRNPYGPARRSSSTRATERDGRVREQTSKVCIDFPARRARPSSSATRVRVQDRRSRSTSSRSSASGTITIRGASTMRDRAASQTSGDPLDYDGRATTSGRAHDAAGSQRRARRRPRDGGGHDPRLPAPDGARRRRRELVHAQASAAEPRRRGRVRRRRRVRGELEGVRPDGRRRADGVDRRARSPTRRASTRATPRRPTTATRHALPATLRNTEIANQANLDVVINSNDPDYTDDTDYTDGGAARRRRATPASCTRRRRHLGGRATGRTSGSRSATCRRSSAPSGSRSARNGARARVEIRPATSGNRFLPLAVPNNVITKVQVRYYDECTSPADAALRRMIS